MLNNLGASKIQIMVIIIEHRIIAVVVRQLINPNLNIRSDNIFPTVTNPLTGCISMNFLIDKGKEPILIAMKGIKTTKNPITNDTYDFCINELMVATTVPIAKRLTQAMNINNKYALPNVKL